MAAAGKLWIKKANYQSPFSDLVIQHIEFYKSRKRGKAILLLRPVKITLIRVKQS